MAVFLSAPDSLKKAIECRLWKKEWGRFIRSIRTKLNPWGDEYSQDRVVMRTDPKGNMRDFTLEDGTLDVSLLGLCIPFEVFDAGDERMERTVEIVEKALDAPVTGGIMRYENDGYIGGNPWVIATLWVALYHIRKENYQQALKYFEWAVKSKTGMGLLPEQVSKDSGKPAWVTPLTWSHAMFVLVLTELIDKGVL
jgi:glucoamylase